MVLIQSNNPMKTSSAKRTNLQILPVIAILLGAMALSGCNTVKGAGKDIEKAGDKIQDSADRHR